MDASLFKPQNWEQFLLSGQLFDDSNRFILDQPKEPSACPIVFVIGCGRSGTTLLSQILSKHPSTLFLNEPRSLWLTAFPELDVWSMTALLNSKHTLCPSSYDNLDANRDQMLAFYQSLLTKYDKQIVIEKFPSHCFRTDFLRQLFPKCKILHIVRNGHSVARSIQKFTANAWYGVDGKVKWNALCSFISSHGLIEGFDNVIAEKKVSLSMYQKGLIEWTASILSVRANLSASDEVNNQYLEVRYEDITDSDEEVRVEAVQSVLDFVGDLDDPDSIRNALEIIKIKSEKLDISDLKEEDVLFEETRLLLDEMKVMNNDEDEESEDEVEDLEDGVEGMGLAVNSDVNCVCINDLGRFPEEEFVMSLCHQILGRLDHVFVVGYGECAHKACEWADKLIVSNVVEIEKVRTSVEVMGNYKGNTKMLFKLKRKREE